MFLVEVAQGGIFQIRNVPPPDLDAVLGTLCPNTLLPYAREVVASIVQRAGFPPVTLQHMNFDVIYQQRLQHSSSRCKSRRAPPPRRRRTDAPAGAAHFAFAVALKRRGGRLEPARACARFSCGRRSAAILYDGPTVKASSLYVVNRGYPLEVVVTVEGWVKVRDANGALSWIEAKQLTDKRTVMVKVARRRAQKPDDGAPVAFQAQQNVLLELVDVSGGWIHVRHPKAGSG